MLTHDQILEIAQAVVEAGLAPESLRAGLPPSFVASFRPAPRPDGQLLEDLQTMCTAEKLQDGSVPLRIWLKNAEYLAGLRAGAAVFQRALASLDSDPGEPAAPVRGGGPRAAVAREPATILFLGANPSDTTRLALDKEVREIEHRLRSSELRGAFILKQAWAVRAADLQESLLRYRPSIVHFGGHGEQSGELLLEDERGVVRPVPIPAFTGLFRVLGKSIRCVVLNACFSEPQARAIADHVDYVVGMSSAIPDASAIAFSGAFYQALGYGESVQTAFDLGRNRIDLLGQGTGHIPVLVTRAMKPAERSSSFVLDAGASVPVASMQPLLRPAGRVESAASRVPSENSRIMHPEELTGDERFLFLRALASRYGSGEDLKNPLANYEDLRSVAMMIPDHAGIKDAAAMALDAASREGFIPLFVVAVANDRRRNVRLHEAASAYLMRVGRVVGHAVNDTEAANFAEDTLGRLDDALPSVCAEVAAQLSRRLRTSVGSRG